MLTAYIGSYAPNGGGIHGLHFQPGAPPMLAGEPWVADADSPSWLTVNAAGDRLYAVHELHRASGHGEGRLSSYAIGGGQPPRLLASVRSGGVRPVHLSLHPGDRHAFVAHYDSGDVSVLGIDGDGRLGPLLDSQRLADALPGARPGPARAADAAPGSFASSGHDAPHAHAAVPDPSGRFVLCTDLGLDAVIAWRFDAGRGRLDEPRVLHGSRGAGPRHLVFHPREPSLLYLLNEEASTLAWLRLDGDGRPHRLGDTSSLPASFTGTAYASDLCCAPDGHHLYALNRLHDSIAHFTLAPDGTPTLRDTHWCRGSYPRTLALLPGGRGLVVCNQRSDHLAWFTLDGEGVPRFTGRWTGVGGAASVVFG